jgi:hypothetical protein
MVPLKPALIAMEIPDVAMTKAQIEKALFQSCSQ